MEWTGPAGTKPQDRVEWGTGAGIKGMGCGVDRARW